MEGLMPLLAPQMLARNLHETNARLGLWLDGLVADSAGASAQARVASPQQMAGLLSELMRAGEWLRDLPVSRDEAVEQELTVYRKHVERLRDLLPSIHGALLRERGRLEQERARVESAAEWARGSRQIL
jgi:hypothetical protein